MNLQELQTMVHHQLPIKLIIFNNDGYLMIKHTQKAVANGRFAGTDKKSGISCPDFSKLAQSFGIDAVAVSQRSEVAAAVQGARKSRRATVIDFQVEQEDSVFPMVPAGADLHKMILRPSPIVETAAD